MSLATRAVNMLKSPKTEWDVVAAESATTGGLFTGYAVPLSLLSSIASFISSAFFASAVLGAFGVVHSTTYFMGTAAIGWVLGLVGLFIAAYVVNMLAPTFGSTKSDINAMKLVVYANTGSWVGGILNVIPFLGMLGAVAGSIYSIYLFYLGLPKMMGTPQEKVVGYLVVSALVVIVITVVMGSIVTAIGGALFYSAASSVRVY